MTTTCFCCNSEATVRLTKKGYDYYECGNCKTLFVPDGINQADMVGGGYEVERNVEQNQTRIDRFAALTGIYGRILDFGCGHGMLVDDCQKLGLKCDGYDKFNPELDTFKQYKYNLVTLIEVIEHTFQPFVELDVIREKLTDNGVVYIETSFVDVAQEETIPLEEFFYISTDVGHCTIFSHYGLDLLMTAKGFSPLKHINRNARIYQKA